jgi:AcrR family transcriptional regulator
MSAPEPAETTPFRSRGQRLADREQKREAVLLAAVRTFNARGFHAASLDEVAAALQISKPTIYHYLGNKEQVLLECVARGLEQLRGAADAALKEEGTGLDRLRSFLLRYAAINMDDFGRCVIRTGEEMLSADGARRFRAFKREIDTSLRRMVASGVADGSIASTDVKITAFTLAGALNWPGRWYDPNGPMTAAALAERIVAVLIDGIRMPHTPG